MGKYPAKTGHRNWEMPSVHPFTVGASSEMEHQCQQILWSEESKLNPIKVLEVKEVKQGLQTSAKHSRGSVMVCNYISFSVLEIFSEMMQFWTHKSTIRYWSHITASFFSMTKIPNILSMKQKHNFKKENHSVWVMDCPPQSLDLNIIKAEWDHFDRTEEISKSLKKRLEYLRRLFQKTT